MPTYVALLRGVNVGKQTSLSMSELRAVFDELGHTGVATYIQSGNLVFTSAKAMTAADVERAIADGMGRDVAVMLRTAAQMKKVLEANPFPDADTKRLHVGFLGAKPAAAKVKALDLDRFAPEAAAVVGTEVYLHLPDGIGRSKLPDAAIRPLGVPVTVRNWNTVTKLVAMTS